MNFVDIIKLLFIFLISLTKINYNYKLFIKQVICNLIPIIKYYSSHNKLILLFLIFNCFEPIIITLKLK